MELLEHGGFAGDFTQVMRSIRSSFSLIDCVSVGVDRPRYCGLCRDDERGNNALAEIARSCNKNHRPGVRTESNDACARYPHDMKGWNALPVETREHIIARKKLSDIELKDAEKPPYAHNALTMIEENGKEVKILRDNMPYGRPGHGEFGTYFIGCRRTPRITETIGGAVIGLNQFEGDYQSQVRKQELPGEPMTRETRLLSGIVLIKVPTIQ